VKFDVVIVGGGMVGATLALALKKTGLAIALVDATASATFADARIIALNELSYRLYKNLNLECTLAPHATPIKQIHVSERGCFGITRLHASDIGLKALGQVIPAKFINAALNASLDNITIFRPATLTALTRTTSDIQLSLQIGAVNQTIETRFLIGADGTHSTVRSLLKIPATLTPYDQTALVAEIKLKRAHANIAYERFLKDGALAFLPLQNNTAGLIWTAATANIAYLQNLPPSEFLKTLQTTFGYRLGRFEQVTPCGAYPLTRLEITAATFNNVFLIGNAAHTLHPIAAQGLNLALYEIAFLADYIYKKGTLTEFELPLQNFRQTLAHSLTDIFSKKLPLLSLGRSLGLFALDSSAFAKKIFLAKALGANSSFPQLFLEQC
jgi:2-octaprenyl-6-methoxyphenol hydroxylase